MEALAAVALAGNVLQFAEFGIKLLTASGELYGREDLTSNARIQESIDRIRAISNEGITQCDDFKRKLRHATGPDALPVLVQNDARIVKLSHECLDTAQDLQNILDKLKLPRNAPSRGWRSLLIAIKSVASEPEIEAHLAKLRNIKSEIGSTVISSLSAKVDFILIQQSTQFKALSDENQKLVSALLHVQENIATDLRSQLSALSLLLSRAEAQRVAVDGGPGNQTPALNSALGSFSVTEKQLRLEVTKKVLNMLAFDSIRDRFEGIDEAHENTFGWIFQHSTPTMMGDEAQVPASFTKWLAEQPGVYWINGKAASGKSTLMKYILAHPDTPRHLSSWAASADPADSLRLLFASFFFWASGTKEQRSQSGLLRSILYELLIQEPKLVPAVFPEQWSSLYSNSMGFTFDFHATNMPSPSVLDSQKFSWSLLELKRAMRRLISQNEIPLKLCLFVDGLDEYEGDETEIAELFAQFSTTNRVKCCVSSRPHKPFLDAFCNVPSMRLQDLTYQDIQCYVSDKLGADAKMRQLAITRPHDVRDLINEIVSSASGVFLWVRLVVASLLRGLGNDDEIEDLQARLRVLPKDLESLYRHMIMRVDEVYQQESSRMFLLVGTATSPRWDDVSGVVPLSALALRFAVEDHKTLALTAPMHFADKGTTTSWSKAVISKLITRCGGLLEAHINRYGPERADITFMHRTVKDFLEKPENQTVLETRATKQRNAPFIPEFAIVKSMVLVLKAEDKIRDSRHADTVLNLAMLHAQRVESLAEAPRDQINAVLDELIKTAYHWIKQSPSSRPIFYPGCTTYTIAVDCELHQYLRYLLEQENIIRDEHPTSGRRSLLSRATASRIATWERPRNAKVVEVLVEFGANVEETLRFVIIRLREKRFERPPDDGSDWNGKAEVLAIYRSLLIRLIPLQPRRFVEDLSFLQDYPGEWQEVFDAVNSHLPASKSRKKRRRGLLKILLFRS